MNPRFVIRYLAAVALVPAVVAIALPMGAAAATGGDAHQIADAGIFRSSDFPSGWTQSPRKPSADAELDAKAAKIASCKQFLAFSRANKKNPRAKSPDFDLSSAHVNNTVSVYPSAAEATAAMRTFGDARLPACLKRLFTGEFENQLAKDKRVAKRLASVKVGIGRLTGIDIGDEAIAYEGTVAVGLRDGTVTTIGLAVIAVRVDDAIGGYTYTADSDISATLQPAIVASVSRLQAATATT